MSRSVRQLRIEGDVAYVPLTRGYEARIDIEDIPLVAGRNWVSSVSKHADGSVRSVYAMRGERVGAKVHTILMHRVIAGTPEGFETDHINGDGLDNRRANLRHATKNQNQHNSRIPKNNKSGAKGVRWHKQRRKWHAAIMVSGRTHSLGLYECVDEAKAAYDKASTHLHGKYGRAE